ncbi:MAG: hypothetical protein DSZ06_01680 [Sulfurospirillum sp.]|nr:MAG: hypothetical protein DSZ06_01680 [Sulfurospirillum sp.]
MKIVILIGTIFLNFLILGCSDVRNSDKNTNLNSSIKKDETLSKDNNPNIDYDKKINKNFNNIRGYYPTKDEILYKNIIEANSENFCQKISDAPPHSRILLESGYYKNHCAIKNKSYITIMAKSKYGVKYDGDDFFIELLDKNHHIHILGIEVSAFEDSFDSGLLNAHGYSNYDNHHIYVSNCWVHNSGAAILSGPKTHDLTIERSIFADIKQSYYFYALGWHMVFINNVAYHPENNGVCIRGYMPLNKSWSYEESKTADVRKFTDIKALPKNEWTHYVANNFFGEGYGRNASRSWDRGSAISFYLGRDNGDGDDAYLPPQNVIIENNSFYHITPSIAPNGEVFAGAITIDAEAGFGNFDDTIINGIIKGTIIQNNISDTQLIKSFWVKPDPKLLSIKDNKKVDSILLKKRFYEMIDYLKEPKYRFGSFLDKSFNPR